MAVLALAACVGQPVAPPPPVVEMPQPARPVVVVKHQPKRKRHPSVDVTGLSEKEKAAVFGRFDDWEARKGTP